MPYQRLNECNNCGECCKRIRIDMKSGSSPQASCIYTYKQQGKTYCEIKDAYDSGDTDFLNMLPPLHYAFWTNECTDYPDPDDPSHRSPIHELPDKCSYEIVEVD